MIKLNKPPDKFLDRLCEALIVRLDELDSSWSAGQADGMAEIAALVPRLFEFWEAYYAIEEPTEDQLRFRMLLPEIGRVAIYMFVDSFKKVEFYTRVIEDAARYGYQYAEASFGRDLGNALQECGRVEEGLQHLLRAAETHAEVEELEGELGLILADIGASYRILGDYDNAKIFLARAIEELEAVEDDYCKSLAIHGLGLVMFDTGETEKAEKLYLKAIEIREAANLEGELSTTKTCLGVLYSQTGEFEKAFQYLSEGLQLAREQNDWPRISAALLSLAGHCRDTSQFEKGISYASEALLLSREYGEVGIEVAAGVEIGECHFLQDQPQRALEVLDVAEEVASRSDEVIGKANVLVVKSRVLTDLHQAVKAIQLLGQANETYLSINDPHGIAAVEFAYASAFLELGEKEKAFHHADLAKTKFAEIESHTATQIEEWIKKRFQSLEQPVINQSEFDQKRLAEINPERLQLGKLVAANSANEHEKTRYAQLQNEACIILRRLTPMPDSKLEEIFELRARLEDD